MSTPPPDPPELKQARALWLQDRSDEALAKFDEVLSRHPNHPLALLDAARAFGASYQIAKAENLLDRYLDNSGRSATTLALAGQTCRMIHRGHKALGYLQQSRELAPPDPAAGLELAMLLDRSGQTADAEDLLAELLTRHPDFTEGHFFRCHVAIRRGDYGSAIPDLEKTASDLRQHPYLRTRACYALAEAADRSGNPAEAIRQAQRAKDLGQPDAPPMRQIAALIRKQGDQLIRSLTPAKLAEWQRQDRTPVPLVLMTGSPRSGTTLLEKVLDAHPQLQSSDEHDLFARFIAPPVLQPPGMAGSGDAGKRLLAVTPARAAAMRSEYLAGMAELLGQPLGDHTLLDKNPSLTELIPAWLRMAPHSRILVMLRDPRDVVLSCYLNYFPLNAYSVSFLDIADTAQRYLREMESWLRLREKLPAEQWREVRYEDCVKDLPGTAKDTLAWMKLPWREEVLAYRETLKQRLTQSPTYADVQAPLHTRAIGRWQSYTDLLGPVLPLLEPLVKRLGY